MLSVGDKKDNKCNFLMCVGWGKWRRDMYNKQSVCVCVAKSVVLAVYIQQRSVWQVCEEEKGI